jgi:hypothetical protein
VNKSGENYAGNEQFTVLRQENIQKYGVVVGFWRGNFTQRCIFIEETYLSMGTKRLRAYGIIYTCGTENISSRQAHLQCPTPEVPIGHDLAGL